MLLEGPPGPSDELIYLLDARVSFLGLFTLGDVVAFVIEDESVSTQPPDQVWERYQFCKFVVVIVSKVILFHEYFGEFAGGEFRHWVRREMTPPHARTAISIGSTTRVKFHRYPRS